LTILLKIRLPRVLLGLAAGASLGVSGAGFQAVFRNALADPFIIGASSGASLGAAVAMIFPFFFPFSASLFAFFGGLAAVFTAWGVSRSAGNPPSSLTLLLAGTCVSSLCSGVLALLLIMKDRNLQRVYYWSLGSLAVSWDAVLPALPFMGTGCLIIFLSARAMDLLLQGDETAESLGLDVKKARFLIISGASLAASAVVSVCGIIGFAGLAAPHIARIFMGPVHRRMSPASALAGALLVALADILSRVLAPPLEIPIGVIMTLAGAPFFLYLIVKYGKNLGIRN
jgi:iron complex transport system permease protein